MPTSCKDIRAALAQCLSTSPCVLAGNSAVDCLREPLVHDLPVRCQQLKRGYGDCKRGLVDMRKRFRGNRPIGSTTVEEGESRYVDGVAGGMLYASIGRKDLGVQRELHDAEEDEVRGREELVPDRFKDGGGGVDLTRSSYSVPEGFDPDKVVRVKPVANNDGEGAGWTWWRGS